MREAEQTRAGPQAQAIAEEFLFQNIRSQDSAPLTP